MRTMMRDIMAEVDIKMNQMVGCDVFNMLSEIWRQGGPLNRINTDPFLDSKNVEDHFDNIYKKDDISRPSTILPNATFKGKKHWFLIKLYYL